MRAWNGLDDNERTLDEIKGYVEVNDDVKSDIYL